MAYDEALAERIRSVLDGTAGIEERRMFGGLSFLIHGRMCCGVIGSDLVVRVPLEKCEAALRKAHVRPMDFTGKPLRGFVYVGAQAIRSRAALRTWTELGREVAAQAAKASSRQTSRPRSRARTRTA